MYSSGAAIGTVNTPRVLSRIQRDQKRAQTAWSVAEVGTAGPRVVGRRTVSGTNRLAAAASLAVALSSVPMEGKLKRLWSDAVVFRFSSVSA